MTVRPLPRRPLRSALAAAATVAAAAALSMSAGSPASAADPEPASARVVEMTPALQAQIQQLVDAFQATNGIPGVSVAVVTPDPVGPDPVITTFAAGVPALESPTPVDASTQFELGSETKVFTADLLAYLVASGQVSLDDPLQDYAPPGILVPEWIDPQTGERTAITLGDLATHQAGLTDLPPNFWDECGGATGCNPRPGYTQAVLWDAFELPCWEGRHCPLWKPGTDWLYSDWGFALLGTILANVLDPVDESQPPALQAALDQTFLDALGMTSTALEIPGDPRLAIPYKADGNEAFYWDNTNAFSGAGGLVSDATDMGTWVAAHLGYGGSAAPLGVQTMADTLEPVSRITTRCATPPDCTPADFEMGLGWERYSAKAQGVGVPWAFKNGMTEGSSSDTALAPGLGAGVTTMWNKQQPQGGAAGLRLAAPLLALLVAASTDPGSAGGSPAESAPAVLAESGVPASELLVAATAAAVLVAGGGILIARRSSRA